MSKEEMLALVKDNLEIEDNSKDFLITDVIQDVINYCNLVDLPDELEPFIRRKVKNIMNYEAENGAGAVFDVKSIKEGDTSITYNVDGSTSKETIYGLSDRDKKTLQAFRRTRK